MRFNHPPDCLFNVDFFFFSFTKLSRFYIIASMFILSLVHFRFRCRKDTERTLVLSSIEQKERKYRLVMIFLFSKSFVRFLSSPSLSHTSRSALLRVVYECIFSLHPLTKRRKISLNLNSFLHSLSFFSIIIHFFVVAAGCYFHFGVHT